MDEMQTYSGQVVLLQSVSSFNGTAPRSNALFKEGNRTGNSDSGTTTVWKQNDTGRDDYFVIMRQVSNFFAQSNAIVMRKYVNA